MKTRIIIILSILAILLTSVLTVAASDESVFAQVGQYLKDYFSNEQQISEIEGTSDLAATYHDNIITRSVLDLHRKTRILLFNESVDNLSDYQLVNMLVKDMMLHEEAERLGLSATQAEIDNLVNETKRTYEEHPEIKEVLDDYCKGAEISIDDYFALIENSAPALLATGKLRTEIGRQYCEENGIAFSASNPSQEVLDAIEDYFDALFEENKDQIVYYIDVEA